MSSEVVPEVLDQVPESCDPCDSLAESKPEFDEGLKSGPDQIEPALDSKDRLFDLVTNFFTVSERAYFMKLNSGNALVLNNSCFYITIITLEK